MSLEDPGAGYAMQYETQASISGEASIFQRYDTSTFNTELVIATGSGYEILVERNVTPMPGDESKVFLVLPQWPVVDQGGQDAAFIGVGSLQRGVYKRVNGGPLQTSTPLILRGWRKRSFTPRLKTMTFTAATGR